jgi:hypothetical protein
MWRGWATPVVALAALLIVLAGLDLEHWLRTPLQPLAGEMPLDEPAVEHARGQASCVLCAPPLPATSPPAVKHDTSGPSLQ